MMVIDSVVAILVIAYCSPETNNSSPKNA